MTLIFGDFQLSYFQRRTPRLLLMEYTKPLGKVLHEFVYV
jgi:hypothetical protein